MAKSKKKSKTAVRSRAARTKAVDIDLVPFVFAVDHCPPAACRDDSQLSLEEAAVVALTLDALLPKAPSRQNGEWLTFIEGVSQRL